MRKIIRIIMMFSFLLVWAVIVFVLKAQAEDKPKILSITPKTITHGDTITIEGQGFSKDGATTIVKIDNQQIEFKKVESKNKITVKVDTDPMPENIKTTGEYERSVVVAVDSQESQPYTVNQLTWDVVRKARVFVPALIYLALIGLIVLSIKGSVFRSETGRLSLSKIQMGIWTFVFGFSYILLCVIWKEFLDITKGMFWLMGISSATAAGAKAIIIKNVDKLDKAHPSALVKDYNKETDTYTLSLHRCQIVIWTLIILAIYIIKLYDTMHLPDIPEKLLVLMGISGGTYLGFNFPKPK